MIGCLRGILSYPFAALHYFFPFSSQLIVVFIAIAGTCDDTHDKNRLLSGKLMAMKGFA